MSKKYFIGVLLLLAYAVPAFVQPSFKYPVHYFSLTPQWNYHHISMEAHNVKEKISQSLLPLSVSVPITDALGAQFAGYYVHSRLDAKREYVLSGMADARLRVNFHSPERRLLLSLGVSLPCGESEYNEEQLRVANILAEPILGFRLRRLGHGLDWDMGLAYGLSLMDNLLLGLAGGYMINGEYRFEKARRDAFKPGNEFVCSLGLEWKKNLHAVKTSVLFRDYAHDRLAGKKIFLQGSQFEFDVSYQAKAGRLTGHLRLHEILKGDNEFSSKPPDVYGDWNFIGKSFRLQTELLYDLNKNFTLSGQYLFDSYGDSDFQIDDAFLHGFGGGVYGKILETALLQINAGYIVGHAQQNQVKIHGCDVLAGIQFKF